VFHPGEELDEIVSWNGVAGALIRELIYLCDSGIADRCHRGEIVHEREYCGCLRSAFT